MSNSDPISNDNVVKLLPSKEAIDSVRNTFLHFFLVLEHMVIHPVMLKRLSKRIPNLEKTVYDLHNILSNVENDLFKDAGLFEDTD